MERRAHRGATTPRQGGSVERVDPFDHPDHPLASLVPSASELAQMQLGELRTRIRELDAEVAGLLAQREALTRVAFDIADGSDGTLRVV